MSHYFENDESLKHKPTEFHVMIQQQPYSFQTDSGVFSKKGLDFGTRSLLEILPIQNIHGDILDFGCGYGPIGIFLSKNIDGNIDMIDINERSLTLAQENAKKNKVNVHIFKSNQYVDITKTYDFIITNPPIRVGKEILYQILLGAKKHLKQHGELWFVIHKDQGAKTILKDMKQEYQVELVGKNKGFYIIRAYPDKTTTESVK